MEKMTISNKQLKKEISALKDENEQLKTEVQQVKVRDHVSS